MERNKTQITRDEVITRAAKNHVNFVGFAFGYVKNWSTAEDIVQESYLIIGKKWKDYRSETSILPWARSIIRYRCLTYRDANRNEFAFSSDFIEDVMERQLNEFSDSASAEQLEFQIQTLSKCIGNLNERSQKLIHDFYVKGRLCKDIAQEEGKKEKTPVMHLYRLRNQLRNCMQNRNTSENDESSTEQEQILDDFFTASKLDEDQIKNLFQSVEKGEASITTYLQEWSVFAAAISRIFEEKEETVPLLSNRVSKMEIMEPVNISFPTHGFIETRQREELGIFRKKHYVYAGIAAACLLLCLGLWRVKREPAPRSSFASIASGMVSINNRISTPDHPIFPGDRIQLSDKQSCLITLENESTTFAIFGPGKLTFAKTNSTQGRKIIFNEGKMIADIAKQESGKPFEIETSQSNIKILGTRFELKAHPSKTHLFLDSGRLLLKDKRNGQEKIMVSGQQVVIAEEKRSPNTTKQMEPYSNPIYNADLIASYRFDEGSGQKILDSSTYQKHGPLPKALELQKAWIERPIGSAINFGKVNETLGSPRISILKFVDFEALDQLTIAFWLNCMSSSVDRGKAQSIISCKNEKDGLLISLKETNTLYRVHINIYEDGELFSLPTNKRFDKDKWYHIAISFHAGPTKFYVNGRLDRSRNLFVKSINMPTGELLSIGPQRAPYEIALDNLAIYKRALKASEVSSLTKEN